MSNPKGGGNQQPGGADHNTKVEPWLRGTLTEVDAVKRQVLHALELAEEDAERWCTGLSDGEMHMRPFGLASVAFHLRHIVRSLDRLLTYAEERPLNAEQMAALHSEMDATQTCAELLAVLHTGQQSAASRIMPLDCKRYEEARGIGRAMLPSTLGGLLVHCAEHTQRHAGQMVTTAKLVAGMREAASERSVRRIQPPMATRTNISGISPYEAVIGFSRAVRIGNHVHVSGTGPVGCEDEDAPSQADQCLTLIAKALKEAGSSIEHVIRTRIYLVSCDDWEPIARVHGKFFSLILPAATMVVVAGLLNAKWKVEIEADAWIPESLHVQDRPQAAQPVDPQVIVVSKEVR